MRAGFNCVQSASDFDPTPYQTVVRIRLSNCDYVIAEARFAGHCTCRGIGADEPKDFHECLRLLSANEKFSLAMLALVTTSTRFKSQLIERGRDYDPREDLHP
jgi:hypothetical protein